MYRVSATWKNLEKPGIDPFYLENLENPGIRSKCLEKPGILHIDLEFLKRDNSIFSEVETRSKKCKKLHFFRCTNLQFVSDDNHCAPALLIRVITVVPRYYAPRFTRLHYMYNAVFLVWKKSTTLVSHRVFSLVISIPTEV